MDDPQPRATTIKKTCKQKKLRNSRAGYEGNNPNPSQEQHIAEPPVKKGTPVKKLKRAKKPEPPVKKLKQAKEPEPYSPEIYDPYKPEIVGKSKEKVLPQVGIPQAKVGKGSCPQAYQTRQVAEESVVPPSRKRKSCRKTLDFSNNGKDQNVHKDALPPHFLVPKRKRSFTKSRRNMLSYRIDVFISLTKIFLGDKAFSSWGGSVLDSVVGAFLAQNVTDVLSSCCFMALAAKYPPKHQSVQSPPCGDMELSCGESERPSRQLSQERKCCGHVGTSSTSSEFAHKTCFQPKDIHDTESTSFDFPQVIFESDTDDELNESSPLEDCTSDRESTSSYDDFVEGAYKSCCNDTDDDDELNESNPLEDCTSSDDELNESNPLEDCTSSDDSLEIIYKSCLPGKKTSKIANKVMLPSRKEQKKGQKEDNDVDWDLLRSTFDTCRPRSRDCLDGVDWGAVQRAPLVEVSEVIKQRGMSNKLAARIKDILDRTLDLEWLRDVPPMKAKEFLKSMYGIGLKSVECIQLLAMKDHAFPVDTNVARIVMRLGWVPLKPLPDGLLFHLLRKYPGPNKIQEYLWSRLKRLDFEKLYELHYLLITFGKVFCTKRKPRCNDCPMKGDCMYFASKNASEKLNQAHASEDKEDIEDIEDIVLKKRSVKKKNSSLTEHQVYMLEDDDPILAKFKFEARKPDDPYGYLVKIWTKDDESKLGLHSVKEGGQNFHGTILIPCKTANHGSFPLNGTFFQPNEFFADDETSTNPILISKEFLLNKPTHTLYCGTSITSMFTGVGIQKIVDCFTSGFMCIRGFNKTTRKQTTLNSMFLETKPTRRRRLKV